MDYTKKTPEQLIIIIGERDSKIDALLAQLKERDGTIVVLKKTIEGHEKELAENKLALVASEKAMEQYLQASEEIQATIVQNAGEILTLQNRVNELTDQNKSLTGQVQEAGVLVTDLKGQLNQANQTIELATDEVIVKHGTKNYRAKIKQFSHEGIAYKASDLKSKPDLVKVLIDEQLGVLEPVKA